MRSGHPGEDRRGGQGYEGEGRDAERLVRPEFWISDRAWHHELRDGATMSEAEALAAEAPEPAAREPGRRLSVIDSH